MNETQLRSVDLQKVRGWVYDALRHPLPPNPTGLGFVLEHVLSKAEEAGLVEQRVPPPPIRDIPAWLSDSVREVVWDLIIQGILVPGVGNQSHNASLPHFRITEWGKHCLDAGEYLPHDAGQYIERLKKRIPTFDSVALVYLTESLKCFRNGTHIASIVMLGVASERLLVVLRDAIYRVLGNDEKKKRFLTATQGKLIKRVYEEVSKKLDPVREQMPVTLGESVNNQLAGIFNLIRTTRNDAGHPTGRSIDREEAYALLQLFHEYAKAVYAVIEWLSTLKNF